MQTSDNKNSLTNEIRKYIDLRVEYLQLLFVEKTSLLIGKIVLIGAIGLFALAIGLLLMILVNDLLMEWIKISWVVTLIEIAFVGLLLLVLWIFRNKLIIHPIANMIVNVLYNPADRELSTKKDDDQL